MGIQRRGSLKIIDLAETKGEAPVNNIAIKNPISVVSAIMILVSGYLVLIAGNSPQHGCAISGCRFPDITVNISHWFPGGRTGGWMYDHVTTKISWMDTSP